MPYHRPGSLMAFLAEVPDPRGAPGKRHPIVAMLTHACCAMLCGCRGYAAIAQWGRDQPIELMHKLGYRRTPASYGAFQSLLSRLDAKALEDALSGWVEHLLGDRAPDALRAVAIDGKTSRGSRSALDAAVHLLAAMDQATGCVLGQMPVDAKTDEHKAALELLRGLALEGRVVTGDAMSCQRDLSAQVVAAGGTNSGRSTTISRRSRRRSRRPSSRRVPPYGRRLQAAELDRARTLDAHGDRVETRALEATTMLVGYLDWPGVAQVCRVEPEVKRGGQESYEVSHAITSVPRDQADAATLLAWHRGHWGIENRLHYVRDVTMGEDANRTRVGSGPQVLAALRNAAIGRMRISGSINIAASLRRNAARVRDLLGIMRILTN